MRFTLLKLYMNSQYAKNFNESGWACQEFGHSTIKNKSK
jgi:hypothetical protein